MACYDKFLKKLKTIKHKKGLQALREERGAIFVLTALMLPVLLGCMGIAYDVGNLYMHKARLQNVTDAAALAGGGLFKNPPEKAEPTEADEYISATSGKVVKLVNNVEVVVKEIQNVDYKDGTTIKDREGGTTVTTNSPNHVKADLEAKRYIERNAVNLGNLITTEELSALAYNDSKTTKVNGTPTTSGNVTTTVNTETTKVTDAKFYRVIASEEVPLYFLPVILGENKRTQTVRTTSVAMLDNNSNVTTKTTTIKVTGGGNPVTPTTKTIFSYLFTVADYIKVPNKLAKYEHDDVANTLDIAQTTFDGDIVYTSDKTNLDYDGKDPFKYFHANSAAKGIQKRFMEIMDQYAYYAEKNKSIDITDSQYQDTFRSVFNSSSAVILTSNELKTSVMNNKNSNIFIGGNDGGRTLVIDEELQGDIDTPVYFMFTGVHQFLIDVQCDTRRPIVLVWLQQGSETMSFYYSNNNLTEVLFKGVVYVPYRRVQINNLTGFKFYGNIIAREIEAQGSSQEYHWVDYLSNRQEFSNQLPEINAQPKTITQEIYNQYFADSLKYYTEHNAVNFGKDNTTDVFQWVKDNFNNLEAFENAVDSDEVNAYPPTKKYILKAWSYTYQRTVEQLKAAYSSFQLSDLNGINKFPWDEYTQSTEPGKTDTDVKTDTKPSPTQFRLINPRTETNPYFASDSDI